MCCQNSWALVLKDVCSFLMPADSWAYAIPYRGIKQEFLKLPPPRGFYMPRAARPFTPRIARMVTHSEMWHRYVPELGNWHDGNFIFDTEPPFSGYVLVVRIRQCLKTDILRKSEQAAGSNGAGEGDVRYLGFCGTSGVM